MNKTIVSIISILLGFTLILSSANASDSSSEDGSGHDWKKYLTMDPDAKLIDLEDGLFAPDPVFKDLKYDAKAATNVYGGKTKLDEPFYFHFFGRRMYPLGQFNEGLSILGKKNLAHPHLMAFGDWRLVYTYSDDGADEQAEIATRMNLDIDLKITSTERLHAFVRPFDKDGKFTRFSFNDDGVENGFQENLDFNLDALFFEGDFGSILAGITGEYNHIDMPFAVGLMPIIFHNGIWLNDIFTGAAVTIPAMNSPMLDISNMDVTFFYGNDEINSSINGGVLNAVKIFGLNSFIETLEGYFEFGYAFTEDENKLDGDQSYHNAALSFTHRFRNIASLSYRVISNFGGEEISGTTFKPADGTLFLLETSLITSKPYTMVPYMNFFYGIDNPQSVARVGGILQNTGIVFEGDGVTNFQTLEASGNDTWGGAIGWEYLFNLDQQIVLEAAAVIPTKGVTKAGGATKAVDNQYGLGVRYQKPLTASIIFRADLIAGFRDSQENIWAGRTELRWKF